MTALRKILVVDDDPVVGKSFHRVLSKDKGYVVITAHNAAEALERMRDQQYDLVVTDIKMPGMDGVELAERVRARQPWTPVVIVTGFGSAANEQRAMAAGVSAFVHKPLSPEMIEEAGVLARPAPEAAPVAVQTSDAAPCVEAVMAEESRARNIALFFAAPFIGLGYAVMLPVVGMSMLLMQAGRALAHKAEAGATGARIAMLALAPFIGLAFALLMPLIGLAMFAGTALRALARKMTVRAALFAAGLACTPLLGLAFIVTLPLAGTLTLLWVAAHAQTKRYELT